jgi:DNA cross-link repair 1A protein
MPGQARGPRQTSLTAFFGSSPAAPPAAVTTRIQPLRSDLFYDESQRPTKRARISQAATDATNTFEDDNDFMSSPIKRGRSPEISAPIVNKYTEIEHSDSTKAVKTRGGFVIDSDSDSDHDAEDGKDEDEQSTDEAVPNLHHKVEDSNADKGHQPLESADEVSSSSLQLLLRRKSSSQKIPNADTQLPGKLHEDHQDDSREDPDPIPAEGTIDPERPPLMRQDTSLYTPAEFADEEFGDDEFYEGGEEFLERQWMEEQAEMEAAFDEDSKSESGTESVRTPADDFDLPESPAPDNVATCPICDGSLAGLTETKASQHVNACLDGTAPALPKHTVDDHHTSTSPLDAKHRPSSPFKPNTKPAHRFQRAAIARPPQANPFSAAKDPKAAGSAFARLMSGHAEDAAWAEAASNEKDSRGKQSYQRTCPFYKIMPGFSICVDAFRYGKVEGQNAYFLSHFHSDHYIGMTSSWSHGPIYASKVTCNLMRQCLRVNPKYIRVLEFEKKYEVPNTGGVFVTMIPANHCPGSSLYLFEKVTGKNRDGSDRLTRVLHCGDFRACPAHVNHPLLRPNLIDAVTGATRDQWIDTCYLDTTYLTPKYAFPSQSNVIDACAAMCVSLSNEVADPSDEWESSKTTRMGTTMSKFLEAGESTKPKPPSPSDEAKPKPRGRLLVVIGTYSIGKERICLGIAKALNSMIYAPPNKMAICRALEDNELNARLTPNKHEAQVHMQILFEIRAETLHDYLVTLKPHFSRVVGFRPTGWNYRPPTSRFTENPSVDSILHSEGWKSRFNMADLVPQRGSTRDAHCYGVPYSEHSSFRELTMFCCALRIRKVVPTVNVGSARSREKMKTWIEKWEVERRKRGLFEWSEKGGSGGDTEKFEGLHYGV